MKTKNRQTKIQVRPKNPNKNLTVSERMSRLASIKNKKMTSEERKFHAYRMLAYRWRLKNKLPNNFK